MLPAVGFGHVVERNPAREIRAHSGRDPSVRLRIGSRSLPSAIAEARPSSFGTAGAPRVLRDLPRLLPQAGLRLVSTQAHVYAEAASSRFLLSLAETYGPLVAKAGLVPAAKVEWWLADQRRSAEEGTFLRGMQLLRVRGAALTRRPTSSRR
jgi:hypothetical protein